MVLWCNFFYLHVLRVSCIMRVSCIVIINQEIERSRFRLQLVAVCRKLIGSTGRESRGLVEDEKSELFKSFVLFDLI